MKEYINNKRFSEAIMEYYERKKINPNERISDEIGKYLILIATNLGTRYNFNAYTFKDEMILDGILRAIEAFKNFDPTRANPFRIFYENHF